MKKIGKVKTLLKKIGPGFITGASDDDPSGIATYSQTGAHFGYSQLWTAIFSFPFMTVIQEMCGRVGMVTGQGLAGIIRKYYIRPVLFICVLLILIANIINIGADLGAMASSGQLVLHIPFGILLFGMTLFTILLIVLVPYKTYVKYLKYLTLVLLAYIVTAFVVKQDWTKIAYSTFIPSLSFKKDYLINIVAILGTTISPYMFFWQTGQEIEEEVAKGKTDKMGGKVPVLGKKDIDKMRMDTIVGMLLSNVVMWFIMLSTASTLHVHNITDIQTADQAALALKPFVGDFAYIIFALGIIGTGMLAVPVLAGSAAYAVSETFGWKEGLSRKFSQAPAFYGVIIIATLVGLLVNLSSIKPFQMLYYTAVLNGVCAPVLMVLIMLIANNKKIMGKHTNSIFTNIMGWIITGIMTIAAGTLLITSI